MCRKTCADYREKILPGQPRAGTGGNDDCAFGVRTVYFLSMKIGSLIFETPLVLAPMSGHTDLVMRILAREQGCGLVTSEMVSADGLLYGNGRTLGYLATSLRESPLSVQIFGAHPLTMARAAALAQKYGAALVDINMGCPAKKIVKIGAGAALMRTPAVAGSILKEVRRAVSCPLTVKIRTGWNQGQLNGAEIARLAEDCGADAVAVHGRTAAQGYEGSADWDVIGEIKRSVSIPVIGNGDVTQPDDARRMLDQTGCDGVMIGRASMGNPWLFGQCRAVLEQRVPVNPSPDDRYRMILRHLQLTAEYARENMVIPKIRYQVIRYIKGLHECSALRKRVQNRTTLEGLREAVSDYFSTLNGSDSPHES